MHQDAYNAPMSWIVAEIEARGGAVPFDEFMELALYHPVHGYYSGEKPRYGRDGDFLTAPTSSAWYPRVLARLFIALAGDLKPLRFVDAASGDGSLIWELLKALGQGAGATLAEVVSVERSAAMRSRQLEHLDGAPVPVRWVDDIAGVGARSEPTVVHASELFDAQPVVRVVGRGGGLRELWVHLTGEGLGWEERPARSKVAAYFARHGVHLVEGQLAEANLGALALHRSLLGAAGTDGLALVLDYGYEARRLYDPRGRGGGSLATFRRHRVGRDPLESPGEVDLTAHVNWDDLRAAAAVEGWSEIGLWPLAEFLVRAGIGNELDARGLGMEAELDVATVTARQEVKRLLDPDGMGSDLKVLVQAKGKTEEAARSVFSF